MKVSLFYLPTYLKEVHGPAANLYRDILEEVEFAEQTGFHAAWFAEHHFFPYGGAIPSAIQLATAAAARTRRLRIATGVVQLPLNHPLRVAEQIAMLDSISGGRAVFGMGRGFERAEYDAFNVPMEESRQRFNEAHDLIIKAWSEERFSFDGRFFQVRDLSVIPQPLQKPHPPIFLAAIITEESFLWAGRMGYNLMYVPIVSTREEMRERFGIYRRARAAAGHDPNTAQIMVELHFYMGESPRQAKEYPRPFVERFHRTAADANRVEADAAQYKGYGGLAAKFEELAGNYDHIYPERAIFGDEEQILARFADLAEAGITEVALKVNFGGMPQREIMRSLERFAARVLPKIS
ncbi:MAG TPA: LLM class flavin-dependent oxidoreductase [Candidatus Binataceae bacterium]|nr:LLM class flavin-dependent oxidoreductase [Candidatus Binataceae bacterium]